MVDHSGMSSSRVNVVFSDTNTSLSPHVTLCLQSLWFVLVWKLRFLVSADFLHFVLHGPRNHYQFFHSVFLIWLCRASIPDYASQPNNGIFLNKISLFAVHLFSHFILWKVTYNSFCELDISYQHYRRFLLLVKFGKIFCFHLTRKHYKQGRRKHYKSRRAYGLRGTLAGLWKWDLSILSGDKALYEAIKLSAWWIGASP